MKNTTSPVMSQSPRIALVSERAIRSHLALLGHEGLGVTELRVFGGGPARVAYADNPDDVVRLCRQVDGKVLGVYVGVQPRPAHLFDLAPNRWVPARGGQDGNCARDADIEYLTAVFFDIDVVSPQRARGLPASPEELRQSRRAAEILAGQDGLAMSASLCCSGNGHYVLAPIASVSIDDDEAAGKFKCFCQSLADNVTGRIVGARIDPVYNLSRVMRLMGTVNRKAQPAPDRPHRQAHFVAESTRPRSIDLHCMILNAASPQTAATGPALSAALRCDLKKIESCEFVQWCRRRALEVSEPQWFALISNLVRLEGGIRLAHEISALDMFRYNRANTQRVVERVLHRGYRPVACKTIMSPAMVRPAHGVFHCSCLGRCPARAPMYLATSHTLHTR